MLNLYIYSSGIANFDTLGSKENISFDGIYYKDIATYHQYNRKNHIIGIDTLKDRDQEKLETGLHTQFRDERRLFRKNVVDIKGSEDRYWDAGARKLFKRRDGVTIENLALSDKRRALQRKFAEMPEVSRGHKNATYIHSMDYF